MRARACIASGSTGGGAGAVNPYASDFCKQNGIRVVEGECPFMFLPQTAWIHPADGMCRKLLGRIRNRLAVECRAGWPSCVGGKVCRIAWIPCGVKSSK